MDNTITKRTVGHKLSLAEKGHITELIVTLLLKNANPSEINLACKPFNLSERMIRSYKHKCYEMIANRPLEAIERAKRIEYSRIEQKQTEYEHTRDWTELEKLKIRLLGLENNDINITMNKHDSVDDDRLIELVLDNE